MSAIQCPECHGTQHAVRRPLTRSVRAPWYFALMNGLGARLPTMVEQRCGATVTCHGAKCGITFCIGDGGPHDTWIPPEEANSPVVTLRDREEGARPATRPKLVDDPADGLRTRTLR